MKKTFAFVLVLFLMASLCACQAAQYTEQPSAEPGAKETPISIPEPNSEVTSEPIPEPTAEVTPESIPEPTAEVTSEPVSEPAAPVHPYAWLGYDELPACSYYDAICSQVFYREYDVYALDYVSHSVEASDGVNMYSLDGLSGILSLILNGEAYSFQTNSKVYVYRDTRDIYQTTLDRRAQRMEQGIDTSGKAYKGTGSEPIPLYCDKGDAESYTYYEFFTDGQNPLTERVYFKDGDVFAIYTGFATGTGETSETTQVITAHSASPDPALFALPDYFDEYTLHE